MKKALPGIVVIAFLATLVSCGVRVQEIGTSTSTISCRGTCSTTNNTTYCALTFNNGKATCSCSGGGTGCTIMVLDKSTNTELQGDALTRFEDNFSKKEHFETQLKEYGSSIYDTTPYKIDSITTSTDGKLYYIQYFISGGMGDKSILFTYDGTTKIAWECNGTCNEGMCYPVCEVADNQFKVICSCEGDGCQLVKKEIK